MFCLTKNTLEFSIGLSANISREKSWVQNNRNKCTDTVVKYPFKLEYKYTKFDYIEFSNDKYAIGFGGRQKLTNRISVNAEYFYQLNDKQNNNVLSLGFDIETGGHVFQLHFSNSPAMIDPEFITQTTGEWLKGDIYFGFNISRVFTLNK